MSGFCFMLARKVLINAKIKNKGNGFNGIPKINC
jgi:hypothetical protein